MINRFYILFYSSGSVQCLSSPLWWMPLWLTTIKTHRSHQQVHWREKVLKFAVRYGLLHRAFSHLTGIHTLDTLFCIWLAFTRQVKHKKHVKKKDWVASEAEYLQLVKIGGFDGVLWLGKALIEQWGWFVSVTSVCHQKFELSLDVRKQVRFWCIATRFQNLLWHGLFQCLVDINGFPSTQT